MVEQSADKRHLILFDGGCGFCARAVAWVPPNDVKGRFRYASLTSGEASNLLAHQGILNGSSDTLLVFPGPLGNRGTPLAKSAAVMFIVRRLRWPWRALAILGWLPARLLNWAYDHVARSRTMLSGSSKTCPVPAAASKERRTD